MPPPWRSGRRWGWSATQCSPHRAGKAYKALTHVVAALEKAERARREAPVKKTKRISRNRAVRVRGIAQPQPDVQKLARLLIELAEAEIAREKEANQSAQDDGGRK